MGLLKNATPEPTEKEMEVFRRNIASTFPDRIENMNDSGKPEAPAISDSSIDALKYALDAIINNRGDPEGTTNITPAKIKALSRMNVLNLYFKNPKVDVYYNNILNLRQSLTVEPTSVLGILGNLFRSQPNPGSMFSNASKFLRGGRP